jgi:hypothetical protein
LEFKQRIIESYEGLFSTTTKQDTFNSGFGDKWGWYQSIYTVAGGHIFDFERTTKLRLHEFLMFLEFKVDLANESNKQIKKYE